jgi:hypothetical protein
MESAEGNGVHIEVRIPRKPMEATPEGQEDGEENEGQENPHLVGG